MRYEKGRKETTRRRIVEIAARRFRDEGVDGVGVATLMAGAGLTHGGFYAHFDSKEELVRQAVDDALAASADNLAKVQAEGGVEAVIRHYLSPRHRDNPGAGCAIAALAPEIARHPEATRMVLAQGTERFAAVLAPHMGAVDADERRARANALVALIMGTLQLARVEPDAERSAAILESGIAAALRLLG
ncbi:TetR/AcrR family transcriptional regulator [Ancylobacter terrae]|uniref:TetR/AcrR family transcriptional regulator n=1 Tax=Ancylobacter sp. sgz301288 TaxID=3342077 RepID=UPI00385907B2